MGTLRSNRKLVNELREGLDLQSVQAELDHGTITARQAKNIGRFILIVKDLRENPISAVLDQAGNCIGEVSAKTGGVSWIGCRYDRPRPQNSRTLRTRSDSSYRISRVIPIR